MKTKKTITKKRAAEMRKRTMMAVAKKAKAHEKRLAARAKVVELTEEQKNQLVRMYQTTVQNAADAAKSTIDVFLRGYPTPIARIVRGRIVSLLFAQHVEPMVRAMDQVVRMPIPSEAEAANA